MTKYTDPEVIAFRDAWVAAVPEGQVGLGPIDVLRAGFDQQHGAVPPADGCRVETFCIGDVKGERLTPSGGGTNGVLLYLHGGGHVFGSSLSHRHLVSRLADAANVVAYVTDHGLAPENPYPAGLGDAEAVFAHLVQQHPDARVIVGGESAGGNLAAALVVRLLAQGGKLPDRVYLLSPWLDLSQSGTSHRLLATNDAMITKAALEECAVHYAGDLDRTAPELSPMLAALDGFPPVFIQVSADEVLLSDSLVFAERAALAGVRVDLQVWPEMVHAWPLFHFALSQGGKAIAQAGAWIKSDL